MAKGFSEVEAQCRRIIEDARNKVFRPVYLLMGAEPYYPELACKAIIENALDESERDFNETIIYGADADADKVVTAAMRYPVFAERQLVVLKEAQSMDDLDGLATYCSKPLASTILVICMHGSSADKRKALYKAVSAHGEVLESVQLKDYEVPRWVSSFYAGKGLKITPDAAALLAEYAGIDIAKISVETEKMLKNLPEGKTEITASDIEENVGISRQYSIFECTREISYKNAAKALKIASRIGAAPRFMLLMATGPLFTHFYRILKFEAFMMKNPRADNAAKARVLGINPYFLKEYEAAVSNYPPRKCMAAISLLREYDFKGKGGNSGEAGQPELLMELISKILSL